MADGMPTEVPSMALAQTGAQIVCQIFAVACVRQVCAEAALCHAFSAFKSKRVKMRMIFGEERTVAKTGF